MKIKVFILIILFGSCFLATAQNDSINWLEEVQISDIKLKEFSTGQHINVLEDSLLLKNQPRLIETLNFNTPIYFKENGRGMVSSPSFRGTTASQTAVVWNGININSQFNGQLDFNTVNTAAYDEISVRGGGGSVVYGTGAIGGSVHLNNSLSFRKKFEMQILLQYGSFNSLDARYRLKMARNNWSLKLALSRNSSDNDYKYPTGGKNLNGRYYSNAANLAIGYRFSADNILKIISEIYDGERHFSLIRPSENRTKYLDLNNKNLLEWDFDFSEFRQIVRLAYINEEYKYFENIDYDNYSFGNAKNFIAKYDLGYELNEDIFLNTVLENTYTEGEGSSLGNNTRNILSAAILGKHRVTDEFEYEAGFRKEITDNYESPLLFSFGAAYDLTEFYTLKLNASKNFRTPTYNDLYWSSSGDKNLNPETSLQGELGNEFSFKNFSSGLTIYYNNITEMIRWLPGENGVWRPGNEDEVNIYGVEYYIKWKKDFGKDQTLNMNATYGYTISENTKTNRQLIYTPYHKITGNIAYQNHLFTPSLQLLYNGSVYTRTDYSEELPGYLITNFLLDYELDQNWQIGAKVNNLFNEEYQNVEDRWMPGINFNIYLNIKL